MKALEGPDRRAQWLFGNGRGMSSSSTETSSVPLSSGILLHIAVSHAIKSVATIGDAQLAILLHPWSRLGGGMNDPTLRSLVKPLQERNFHVVRYNSRGVGQSTGQPTWTGAGEVDDLHEIVQWGLKSYPEVTSVLLIGYSYGSLISSRHLLLPAPHRLSHLILSYPLSPRGALTLFRSGTYQAALDALVRTPAARILIIYGTKDEFTSEAKYDDWANALRSGAQAQLKIVKIKDATHFWSGEERTLLNEAVFAWLNNTS